MGGRTRLASALLGATVLACSSPRPASCPGDRVGTFHLHGDVVPDAGCPFASGPVDLTATISYGSGATALLCIEVPDAEPLQGTRDGDHVTVTSPDAGANVPSCGCPVQVSETVEGDVARDDGGSAVAFSGELRNDVWAADGGAGCERDAGPPTCGVPCELRWSLTTTP